MLRNEAIRKAAAVLLALALWQAAAMILRQALLVVSPLAVAERLFAMIREADFWASVAYSFSRITLGFLLAFACGALLAVLAGKIPWVETLLWPFLVTIQSVPVASFIIIALIWLTSARLSIFISFLMVFPILYTNLLAGLKATDTKLLEMAQIYRMPWRRRLLYLYLPQLKPFLLSACSMGLGLSWKAGVAAEVIGIPDGSIGEKLYEAKVYFNTADLFAWTVVIVLISVTFEKAFLRLLRRVYGRLERIS